MFDTIFGVWTSMTRVYIISAAGAGGGPVPESSIGANGGHWTVCCTSQSEPVQCMCHISHHQHCQHVSCDLQQVPQSPDRK